MSRSDPVVTNGNPCEHANYIYICIFHLANTREVQMKKEISEMNHVDVLIFLLHICPAASGYLLRLALCIAVDELHRCEMKGAPGMRLAGRNPCSDDVVSKGFVCMRLFCTCVCACVRVCMIWQTMLQMRAMMATKSKTANARR